MVYDRGPLSEMVGPVSARAARAVAAADELVEPCECGNGWRLRLGQVLNRFCGAGRRTDVDGMWEYH